MSSRERIIIIGAGVGGLRAALKLSEAINPATTEIVLIDKQPFMAVHFSLFEISTAETPRRAVCLPIREAIKGKKITFWEDIVTAIDPVKQQVTSHNHGVVDYKYLVVALGSVPNDFGIKGLHDHALTYTTFQDALRLRQQLKQLLATSKMVKVVLGGGGASGVELAGAIASRYNKHRNRLSIEVIEQSSTILAPFDPRIQRKAEQILTCRGVTLHTDQCITKVTKKEVALSDGHCLPYDIFIWTGGLKANPVLKQTPFELDKVGRAVVWKTLQIKGYARTYAIGDSAHFDLGDNRALPQLATTALAQADHAVANIIRQLQHRQAIAYQPVQAPIYITLGAWMGILQFGRSLFWSRSLIRFRAWVEFYFLLNYLTIPQAWRMAVMGRR